MVPEFDVARVRRWAAQRVPEHARDQIRIELDVSDWTVTILERRPPPDPERMGPEWTRIPIVRLRYTKSRAEWSLYWRDRNLQFHRYDLVKPTADIGELITEIDRDPTGIFWG